MMRYNETAQRLLENDGKPIASIEDDGCWGYSFWTRPKLFKDAPTSTTHHTSNGSDDLEGQLLDA